MTKSRFLASLGMTCGCYDIVIPRPKAEKSAFSLKQPKSRFLAKFIPGGGLEITCVYHVNVIPRSMATRNLLCYFFNFRFLAALEMTGDFVVNSKS